MDGDRGFDRVEEARLSGALIEASAGKPDGWMAIIRRTECAREFTG